MVLIQKIGIAFSVQLLGFLLYLSGYQSCIVDKDGIRDPVMSRGLGDVYKRQIFIRLSVMLC